MATERVSERYELHEEIASGGMATVHLGRLMGPAGFSKTVAIKRLHPHLAKDPAFVAMFMDEARVAACIRHANVVATLDVVNANGELFHVMEYVEGLSVAAMLQERHEGLRPGVAIAIARDACAGLHAAHEARGADGAALAIVHRDVSPQNILVGRDGVTRLLDFGVAKAMSRSQTTQDGAVKGKVPYMAPEQLRGREVDRRADIYAIGVVLWEMLAGRRLFRSDDPAATIALVLASAVPPLTEVAPEVDEALERVVNRALSSERGDRFATAEELRDALHDCDASASASALGRIVDGLAGDQLDRRREAIGAMSAETLVTEVPVTAPTIAAVESVNEEAGEQPSEVGARRSVRQRGRGLVLAAAMAGLGLAGGILLAPQLSRDDPAEPAAHGSAPSTPATTAPLPQQSVMTAAPVSSTVPSATPSAPPASSTTARASAGRKAPPPVRRPSAATASKPKAPSVRGCNPPYTLDANGIKTFKPWCLSK